MRTRAASAILIGLALLSAGCLSALNSSQGEDEVTPQGAEGNQTAGNETDESPSEDETEDEESDGNETTSSSNETDDEDDETTEQGSGNESGQAQEPAWPSPGEASIRPGVQIRSSSGQCTSNFLFLDRGRSQVMLGVAAHCFSQNPDAGSNGCDPAKGPLEPGAEASITGASEPGTLVYSSWWTMQQTNESSGAACNANDFALVEIDPADHDSVNPAVLHFGGPTGLAAAEDVTTGDKVVWYGNSGLRPPVDEIHRNEGYVLTADGWTAVVYSLSPGVQGDSGSGLMTADGDAIGILSTVRLAPEPGSNGIGLLAPMLDYANQHGVSAELVTWDQMGQGRLPT